MVQRAARAEVPPPQPAAADRLSTGKPEELGRGWVILRDCRLGPPARGGARPTVLMHPARGVAVLDILPAETPGAVEAVRARLGLVRFPAIFAGHLPVVHLRVPPQRMPLLPSFLDDAFAAQPPLRLPGGHAWIDVAARALTAEQPPVPRLESRRFRAGGGAAAGARRRKAASLRATGAVLLCLAALGGVLGAALNKAPAPEATGGAAPVAPALPAADETPAPRSNAAPGPPPLAADPAPVPAPPSPARGGAAPAAVPEAASPAPDPLPLPAEIPPPPPPPPQRAATPPRRSDAAAAVGASPPAAKEAPERAALRRQREAAGAGEEPERCGRVSALVGSGAPIGDADMRFFNQNCIRW